MRDESEKGKDRERKTKRGSASWDSYHIENGKKRVKSRFRKFIVRC